MTTTDSLKARMENKPGVIGATIVTHSGRYFDFISPQSDQIDLMDIAWGLSMTCRFGGQCLRFYSVAQHSVLVSRMVPEEHRLAALMHDAAEAYVGDLVGPLKQLIPDFKAIEHRVEAAIFDRFGISYPLDPSVKHADLCLLHTEQRDLTAGAGDSWNGLDAYPAMDGIIVPLSPWDALQLWLHEWHSILGGPLSALEPAPNQKPTWLPPADELEAAAIFLDYVEDDETGSTVRVAAFLRDAVLLQDPVAVDLNMRRGTIAIPAAYSLVELCQDRAGMLSALKRESPELFPAAPAGGGNYYDDFVAQAIADEKGDALDIMPGVQPSNPWPRT